MLPKTLANELERAARSALLSMPHAQGLAHLVERMRAAKGPTHQIPDFDPLDGGRETQVLFLLEAPGPKAVASGFVSRNNPDETAKNFFLFNVEAGIDRRRTIIWNAVPWYIGSGTKIRRAKRGDVREADAWLQALLETLGRLRFVMFVGKQALHAHAFAACFAVGADARGGVRRPARGQACVSRTALARFGLCRTGSISYGSERLDIKYA
jgi:uracil-DNA glycosylase